MEAIIRPARPGDLKAMVALLGRLFAIEVDFVIAPEKQRRGLSLLLDRSGSESCVLVAEAENRVVGMVSGQMLVSTAQGGLGLLVEDLIVAEAWRGRQIGRRLMERLETWARQNGADRMQLLADRENRPAIDFYGQLQWQPTQLICLRKMI